MSGLRFRHTELEEFVRRLLDASRVPPGPAGLVAQSLVAASLRGTDSHGIQLLTFYLRQLDDGRVNPLAQGRVISNSGSLLHYDGENALGQVVAENCCGHAVRLAREHGVGIVSVRESNHFGAAAWWGRRISSNGMLGVVMCNASPSVPPWQGKDPRWGTNPICVSAPGNHWLLDMATTTVAQGRIYKAKFSGQDTIPHGWAMDAGGVPTTSTAAALTGLLMPLGGYKGSGLAMMAEIFCGVLAGGAMSTELGGLRFTDRPFRVSQFFLALDIARIMPVAEFEERLARLVAMAKSASPAPGYDEVLVAGEPEWRAEAENLRDGVPLTNGVWEDLRAHALRLGVPAPTPLGSDPRP
jgi:LDH2 family malate/lactate/ureidoglycolate dehydrogenase